MDSPDLWKQLRKSVPYWLVLSTVSGILYQNLFKSYTDYESTWRTLLIALFYTSVICSSNIILNYILNKQFSWTYELRRRLLYGVILTIVVNTGLVFGLNYVIFIWIQQTAPQEFFSGTLAFTNWFVINLSLLISAIVQAAGFKDSLKNIYQQRVVEQQFIATTASTQVQSLKNQLDPHFLFNSLNVLTSLIQEDSLAAQNFTQSMSKVYRYVIEQNTKELATVKEELEFARLYSKMLQTRFDDSVQFIFPDASLTEGFIVPLSLQLVLENCIKHNKATSEHPLIVQISLEGKFLSVTNNMQRKDYSTSGLGIGLQNITNRYSLLTDRPVTIIQNTEYFKIILPILTKKQNIMTTTKAPITEYEKAYKRVEELKGFYGNLISYCIFIPFLFFINWQTSTAYWWAFWPMLGWGIGVVSHAFKVFGIGREWEERQIKKYMEKKSENRENWN